MWVARFSPGRPSLRLLTGARLQKSALAGLAVMSWLLLTAIDVRSQDDRLPGNNGGRFPVPEFLPGTVNTMPPDAGRFNTSIDPARVANGSLVRNNLLVGRILFFTADDGFTGNELWRTGEGPTQRLADINPGVGSSDPDYLTTFNGLLYFSADDGKDGRQLFRTDGNRVEKVVDPKNPRVRDPRYLTVFNNALYFSANGPSGVELYRHYNNNTIELVRDINEGAESSYPLSLTPYRDWLYFTAYDETYGRELWRANAGVCERVMDINPNAGSSNPGNLTVFNDVLYFSAFHPASGTELWHHYGTTTKMAADINTARGGAASSHPHSFTPFSVAGQNWLYFVADDGEHGMELWRTAGNTTELVRDIYAGPISSSPEELTVVGNVLYFVAENARHGRELWRHYGSTVELVHDINPVGSSNPHYLTVYDDGYGPKLYYAAYHPARGTELWRTFGSATEVFASINPKGNANPSWLTVCNGTLYFVVDDGKHGAELWRTNGTPNNARLVFDINEDGSANPASLTVY
jgi:ELWxxDGT repeat protein